MKSRSSCLSISAWLKCIDGWEGMLRQPLFSSASSTKQPRITTLFPKCMSPCLASCFPARWAIPQEHCPWSDTAREPMSWIFFSAKNWRAIADSVTQVTTKQLHLPIRAFVRIFLAGPSIYKLESLYRGSGTARSTFLASFEWFECGGRNSNEYGRAYLCHRRDRVSRNAVGSRTIGSAAACQAGAAHPRQAGPIGSAARGLDCPSRRAAPRRG